MKAAYFEQHGGPEVIRYGDLPDPEAGPGEIVVDIHAASVNGADCKVLAGQYSRITDFPYVLGRDFSGVAAVLGDGVDEFAPGDPVFGVCDVGQEGAYAEKIAMKAALVAPKPDSLSHVDAAALALIGPDGGGLDRGHPGAAAGRDDPDTGRRRRGRRFRHSTRQAHRRARHRDVQRPQRRLCARLGRQTR